MNNQIPKIKIDGERAINLMKMFDLTETELELMNNILSEHHKNKTELEGWNEPALVRYDELKGYVKGNVEIVSQLIGSLIDYVRDLRINLPLVDEKGDN